MAISVGIAPIFPSRTTGMVPRPVLYPQLWSKTVASPTPTVSSFLDEFEAPFRSGHWPEPAAVVTSGEGALPSVFATTDFAIASIAAAARAAGRVADGGRERARSVEVDRRLASSWFQWTMDPIGWTLPSPWDDLAGIYATSDGRIRLHTNAPHHRAAAVKVVGGSKETTKPQLAELVSTWAGEDLEAAIVAAGGCAAKLRSESEWQAHEQGSAVAAEPAVHLQWFPDVESRKTSRTSLATMEEHRPLHGVRVLDLTRVLAGPIATRFLAGLGADVLRLDPPDWEEPGVVPEVTLGKRCGRIDLRTGSGRETLLALIGQADIMVHGYRGDALDRLGLGDEMRRHVAPDLVDVRLNAYGWTGPWRHRRGFDSLVQMSCGIANTGGLLQASAGQSSLGEDDPEPKPLPVQALDHATGYLLASAALHGWARHGQDGSGLTARVSLARTAKILIDGPRTDANTDLAPATDVDWQPELEQTAWGPSRRLRPPVSIEGVPLTWDCPATALGGETNLGWD